jgi:nucleotide-binding universal stress UspA family protein
MYMLDRGRLGNVVVATDFSAGGHRAVDRAACLPMAPGARLSVLHVLPGHEVSRPALAEEAARHELARLVESSLSGVSSGVEISVAVSWGEPCAAIARHADTEGAELIVVGKRGEHGGRHRVLGSTADRLVRVSKVGVLVVAANARDAYRRPLVAVDNEGTASAVIRSLAHILTPDVHHGLALHVLDDCSPAAAPAVYSRGDAEIAQLRGASEKSSRAILRPALNALCGCDFAYELRCVDGLPVPAIIDVARAENVDIVAVGTHGRTGLGRLLLGSVAAGVIRDSDVDTLVEHMDERGWMELPAAADRSPPT